MNWEKIGKGLLVPHVAVLLVLLPAGVALLVYSMLNLKETEPIRITSYVLAFYTLTVWCIRIPTIIRWLKSIRTDNKYIQTWLNDPILRIKVSLTGNVLWNGAYAVLQLGLGIYHSSSWFYSLAAYYLLLAIMRFFLVRYSFCHRLGEKMRPELAKYRACGWVLLLMNLTLSAIMLYMIREQRFVRHHEITTIAMATYTFTTLTVAIINVIRYRRYNSPAMSASRAVSLAAACMSMLTLENTMLATFGGDGMTPEIQTLFLGLSGGAISIFIIAMAIYMIVQANRKIKYMENKNG